jgi:hypothetical protein
VFYHLIASEIRGIACGERVLSELDNCICQNYSLTCNVYIMLKFPCWLYVLLKHIYEQVFFITIYSETCAILHPSLSRSFDIRQKFMVLKYFRYLKKTQSIPIFCTIRHISLVPWCIRLDRFQCIYIYNFTLNTYIEH